MKIVIDLEITPRARRAIGWLVLPLAVFAGSVTVAHAWTADTSWIKPHSPIPAPSFSALVAEADSRLNALERAPSPSANNLINVQPGPLPLSNTFSTMGGAAVVIVSGTGYTTSPNSFGVEVVIDGVKRGTSIGYTTESNTHKTFPTNAISVTGLAAGPHTLTLTLAGSGTVDSNDFFNATVIEL